MTTPPRRGAQRRRDRPPGDRSTALHNGPGPGKDRPRARSAPTLAPDVAPFAPPRGSLERRYRGRPRRTPARRPPPSSAISGVDGRGAYVSRSQSATVWPCVRSAVAVPFGRRCPTAHRPAVPIEASCRRRRRLFRADELDRRAGGGSRRLPVLASGAGWRRPMGGVEAFRPGVRRRSLPPSGLNLGRFGSGR